MSRFEDFPENKYSDDFVASHFLESRNGVYIIQTPGKPEESIVVFPSENAEMDDNQFEPDDDSDVLIIWNESYDPETGMVSSGEGDPIHMGNLNDLRIKFDDVLTVDSEDEETKE